MSPGVATQGVTLFFPEKTDDIFLLIIVIFIAFKRVSPPEGVTRGSPLPRPLPSDATVKLQQNLITSLQVMDNLFSKDNKTGLKVKEQGSISQKPTQL